MKNVVHGYRAQIHLLDCGLFTFSTICPHLSCSVQLPLYLCLFYKLTSNKSSSKFSPNTKFWVGNPTLSRTKRKTMLRCLPCKLWFKIVSLSQVIDSLLARGTEQRFVLSTDSPLFQTLHPVHTSAFFITHVKSSPSQNRAFSQRALSNSAAAR